MDETLISKKELLEETNITYGQLYRWKRKKLIPEDWFIRKSTFTGQETFFPKEKILERVNRIKELKEDLSLDELANAFSPSTKDIQLSKADFEKHNIVSKNAIQIYEEQQGVLKTITFQTALYLYILDKALETGEIGWEEGRQLIQTLSDYYPKLERSQASIVVLRKLGVATVLLVTNASPLFVDSKTKVAVHLKIEDVVNEVLNVFVRSGY
ncbi:YhbD family protein [Robertmurraya sp. Marseille-Q9965]